MYNSSELVYLDDVSSVAEFYTVCNKSWSFGRVQRYRIKHL